MKKYMILIFLWVVNLPTWAVNQFYPAPTGVRWTEFASLGNSNWIAYEILGKYESSDQGRSWTKSNSVIYDCILCDGAQEVITSSDKHGTNASFQFRQMPSKSWQELKLEPNAYSGGMFKLGSYFLHDDSKRDSLTYWDNPSQSWKAFMSTKNITGSIIEEAFQSQNYLYLHTRNAVTYVDSLLQTKTITLPTVQYYYKNKQHPKSPILEADSFALILNPIQGNYQKVQFDLNWIKGEVDDYELVGDTFFVALGNDAIKGIWKTGDLGKTWIRDLELPVDEKGGSIDFNLLEGKLVLSFFQSHSYIRENGNWRNITHGIRALLVRNSLLSSAGQYLNAYTGLNFYKNIGGDWIIANTAATTDTVLQNVEQSTAKILWHEDIIAATKKNGVFKSIDLGKSWTLLSKTPQFNSGMIMGNSNTLTRHNDTLLLGPADSVYRSKDGGQNWELFSTKELNRPKYYSYPQMCGVERYYINSTERQKVKCWNGSTWDTVYRSTSPNVEIAATQNALYIQDNQDVYKSSDLKTFIKVASNTIFSTIMASDHLVMVGSNPTLNPNNSARLYDGIEYLISQDEGVSWQNSRLDNQMFMSMYEKNGQVIVEAINGDLYQLDASHPIWNPALSPNKDLFLSHFWMSQIQKGIQLNSPNQYTGILEIRNSQGQLVWSQNLNFTQSMQVDLSTLAAGSYLAIWKSTLGKQYLRLRL